MFEIRATHTFMKYFNSMFDSIEQKKFNNFKERLKQNLMLGDQIRIKYVREFKTKGKRVYFIINEETKIILFVACSNKNNQKFVIKEIFDNLETLKSHTY